MSFKTYFKYLPLQKNYKFHKDFIGKKFGSLTVLEPLGIYKNHTYWLTKCDCGEFCEKTKIALKNNKNNMCSKCFKNNKHYAWKGYGEIPKDVFNTIKHGASSRNLEFSITIEEIYNLFKKQENKCALTGWQISFNKTYETKTSKTASLDRIDSKKGYRIDNVQWVHRDVNRLKRNMPNEKFIEMCKAIARKN